MSSWTISRRLVAGFGALFIIVALLAASFEYALRVLDGHVGHVTKSNLPGVIASSEALENALRYRVLTLRHMLTNDPAEWKAIDADCDKLARETLENFKHYAQTASTAEDQALLAKATPAFETYREVARRMRQLNGSGDHAGAQALVTEAGAAFTAYEISVIELTSYNENAAAEAATAIAATMKRTRLLSWIGGGCGLAFALGAALLIPRRINRAIGRIAQALEESSAHVGGAASQIAGASSSLAQGSNQQASSLEETSASLEELSSMTRRNSDSAQQAKELSAQTRTSADAGTGRMDEMRQAMDAIKASSDDIAKIIKTIDEIAFQTNILALNAAVEAARAGEAGAGFAVVAEEVRNLAQRSAQSAKETAGKIEDAIRKSEHGVSISNCVATSLGDIVDKARKVDSLVAEIAQASKEQSDGIGQLNSAVAHMDKVTQSNASNAEETAAAAEQLTAQSQTLRGAIEGLEHLLHGRQARVPAAAAEPSKQAATAVAKSAPIKAPRSPAARPAAAVSKNAPPAPTRTRRTQATLDFADNQPVAVSRH